MKDLKINKTKLWKWLGIKYGAHKKRKRSSNEHLTEFQPKKNIGSITENMS